MIFVMMYLFYELILNQINFSALFLGNTQETKKTEAFVEVLKGVKKVTMDVLLKCEGVLNVSY